MSESFPASALSMFAYRKQDRKARGVRETTKLDGRLVLKPVCMKRGVRI